jgi:hypothetical protein
VLSIRSVPQRRRAAQAPEGHRLSLIAVSGSTTTTLRGATAAPCRGAGRECGCTCTCDCRAAAVPACSRPSAPSTGGR